MTEKEERKALLREGLRRSAITSLYEANRQTLLAKLQELADENEWEANERPHT